VDEPAAQVRLEPLNFAAQRVGRHPEPPRSLGEATGAHDLDELKDLIQVERRITARFGFHPSHCAI
jgi:hypothetical protein